jgi:predicted dinucleotide-binding enzyme
MNDTRTTPEIDSARRLRAERREAATVAQYIHELSARHRSPAVGANSRAPGDDREAKQTVSRLTRAIGALTVSR